jgi:hydroxyacylglutathione hydrolase
MQTHEKNGITVAFITVNPFGENTYILSDSTGECVIIDPGCYTASEQMWLSQHLRAKHLTPVDCWLTHAHLDHVFGCSWVLDTFGLSPKMHKGELPVLAQAPISAQMYGVPMAIPPQPTVFLEENTEISFGNTTLTTLFVPGHSPASLCFYCQAGGFVIAGDTLFEDSIGRTDLPGGNHATLLANIRSQLYTLPAETVVYSGHGKPTTIGKERHSNPFVQL